MKKYLFPWDIPFYERLNQVVSQDLSLRKVVFIYERPDATTFRYRVYNICQALKESASWRGAFFFEEEVSALIPYLAHVQLVVFVRVKWSCKIDVFLHAIKRQGITTLFDIDDLVFDARYIPLLMATLYAHMEDQKTVDYWFSSVSRLAYLAEQTDGTVSTNGFLAGQLEEKFQKKSFIIRNFLNNEQIERSKQIVASRTGKKSGSQPFFIGYFSGTPSHYHDFQVASVEIVEMMETYQDIQLLLVGFMDLPSVFSSLYRAGRIVRVPLVDFLTLQEKIALADINIVPLVDNVFTNCKSELKFFEASIVGTPTIATPTYPYREAIVHGKTGFFAKPGEWFDCLEAIFKGNYDKNMRENAEKYCLETYTPSAQLPLVERVLNSAVS